MIRQTTHYAKLRPQWAALARLLTVALLVAATACLDPQRALLDANSPLNILLSLAAASVDPPIYVNGLSGSDSNDGLKTTSAVKTITKGLQRAQENSYRLIKVTGSVSYSEDLVISSDQFPNGLVLKGGYNETFGQRNPYSMLSSIMGVGGATPVTVMGTTASTIGIQGLDISGGSGATTSAIAISQNATVRVLNNRLDAGAGTQAFAVDIMPAASGRVVIGNNFMTVSGASGDLGGVLVQSDAGGVVIVNNIMTTIPASPTNGYGVRIVNGVGSGTSIGFNTMHINGSTGQFGINYGNLAPAYRHNAIRVVSNNTCISGTAASTSEYNVSDRTGAPTPCVGGGVTAGPTHVAASGTGGGEIPFTTGPAGTFYDVSFYIGGTNATANAGANLASLFFTPSDVSLDQLATEVGNNDSGVVDVGFHYNRSPPAFTP